MDNIVSVPIFFCKNIFCIFPNQNATFVYKVRKVVTLCVMGLLLGCLSYNVMDKSGNIIDFSKSLYMMISVLNGFVKVLTLSVKGPAMLELMEMWKLESFTQCVLYKDTISGPLQNFGNLQKIFLVESMMALFGLIFSPFLDHSKPLPMDFPHFNNGTFHYPFYLFETISIALIAFGNVAPDLLTAGCILIAIIQLKVLNRKLTDCDRNVQQHPHYSAEHAERLTVDYLYECCKHYEDIATFTKRIQEVFSTNIFIQLCCSTAAICNSGVMIMNIELFSIESCSLVSYISALMAQLICYCWFGNSLCFESLEIGTSCYMSEWYQRTPKARKPSIMLMERTKRPLLVKGLGFFTLSFGTFIAILKWSYSYFALLQSYQH